MSKMTIVQLGVILFAICLSTQVVSQTTTNSTEGNFTSNPNATTSNPNATTMAPDTQSSSSNNTNPTGSGVSLHAGTVSFLVPIITGASLLQRYC